MKLGNQSRLLGHVPVKPVNRQIKSGVLQFMPPAMVLPDSTRLP